MTDRSTQDNDGAGENVSPELNRVKSSDQNIVIFSYPQLVGTRVCLGVAEAGLFPGVVW